MKRLFLLIALICLSSVLFGQDIFGKWKTVDDETGDVKSIVEIFEKDGKAYGKVIELFRKADEVQDPHCTACEDDRKGSRILGMEIIRGLENEDGEWEDGTICDPKNGKIYDCKLWLDEDDPNKLNVRGYILFLYRTQAWFRVK